MKRILIGLFVTMVWLTSFGANQGYHDVVIKKVIIHFGYIVLQADSVVGNSGGSFTDQYFIVPKDDNSLSVRKETLAALLSAQASRSNLKIWVHAATLDAGAGIVGNTLYSVQIISN